MNEQTPPRGNPRTAKPTSANRSHPPRFGEVVVPRPPDDDGPIPLVDKPAPPPRRQSAAEREALMLASAVCPSCESNFPPDAILCISCGFDRRTRARVNAPPPQKKAKPAPEIATVICPKCGYNLAGLTSTTCPECGEGFTHASLNRQAKRRSSAAADRQLWLTPSIMLGISSLVCLGYVGYLGGGIVAVAWAIGTGFCMLGGFFGYAVVAATITGWCYNFGNSLLRVNAILMVTTAALIFLPVPFFLLKILVIWLILFGLVKSVMDMDYQAAALAATFMIIGWIFSGLFGIYFISRLI